MSKVKTSKVKRPTGPPPDRMALFIGREDGDWDFIMEITLEKRVEAIDNLSLNDAIRQQIDTIFEALEAQGEEVMLLGREPDMCCPDTLVFDPDEPETGTVVLRRSRPWWAW